MPKSLLQMKGGAPTCQMRRMHGPLGRPWLSRMQPEWRPYTSQTIRRLRQKRCIFASIMTVLRVSSKRFSLMHFFFILL